MTAFLHSSYASQNMVAPNGIVSHGFLVAVMEYQVFVCLATGQ
jgi:hypothetical protein